MKKKKTFRFTLPDKKQAVVHAKSKPKARGHFVKLLGKDIPPGTICEEIYLARGPAPKDSVRLPRRMRALAKS